MRRRGFTLAAAVLVCAAALALLANVMISVNRSSEAQSSGMRRLSARISLASAAAVGRRQLAERIEAGSLPPSTPPAPHSAVIFDGAAAGAAFRVINLDYDTSPLAPAAPVSGDLPPPMRGAFLIRAECEAMALEIVLRAVETEMPDGGRRFLLDERPLLRREIWR